MKNKIEKAMTIKYMDVHTDDGVYKLILDNDQAIDEDGVNDLINDLNVAGTIWHGWTPYDDLNTDAAIVVFGIDANIKSVRIYEVVIQNTENTEPVLVTNTVIPGTLIVEFLGNEHVIDTWLYYFDDGRFNVLPYHVDKTTAALTMRPDNLVSVITSHYEKAGINRKTFTVVIPETPLSVDASAHYLEEYSRKNNRKARAWNGWNDNDDSEE